MESHWAWREVIERYRKRGLITRTIPDVLALVDLGFARGEFLRAVGRFTPAWPSFVARCRTSPDAPACVAEPWLHANRLHVVWMREWCERAIPLVRAQLQARGPDAEVPIDSVLLDAHGAPQPDCLRVLAGLGDVAEMFLAWQVDELPPNPLLETRTDFLRRMDRAYKLRLDFLGPAAPTKRDLTEHAEWCARHYLAGETVGEILDRYPNPPDQSTVKKALKSFPPFIEVPLS